MVQLPIPKASQLRYQAERDAVDIFFHPRGLNYAGSTKKVCANPALRKRYSATTQSLFMYFLIGESNEMWLTLAGGAVIRYNAMDFSEFSAF